MIRKRKRMFTLALAAALLMTLLPGGMVLETGAETTVLDVIYQLSDRSLEDAVGGVRENTYTGIKVSGEKALTAADFQYLSKSWKHAQSIDLGGAISENHTMDEQLSLGVDEDGSATDMAVENLEIGRAHV